MGSNRSYPHTDYAARALTVAVNPNVRAGALAAKTTSRQIGARLRPGSGDLTLAQKVIARDVHDHIALLAPAR